MNVKTELEAVVRWLNNHYNQDSDDYSIFNGAKPGVVRYNDDIAISLWGCGAVVCVVDRLYFIGEDDGHWFLREGTDKNIPRNLYGFATSLSIGWIESFTNALNALKKYVEENGIPVYYAGLTNKIVCHYKLGKSGTEE